MDGKNVYVDSAMVFPVVSKNKDSKILGLLEISSMENTMYGFDDEYFGIVLSIFIAKKLGEIFHQSSIQRELK